jgi:hypothetical protein
VALSPQSNRDWVSAFAGASRSARLDDYSRADSLLEQFSRQHWGSWESLEAAYWRAVFMLDPDNEAGEVRSALPLLELYMADSRSGAHYEAARALWALAISEDSLRVALLDARAETDSARTAVARQQAAVPAREAELQKEIDRLKGELEKATAELDRVKRRLTTPPV